MELDAIWLNRLIAVALIVLVAVTEKKKENAKS